MESMSTPSRPTSMSSMPTACTASVWKTAVAVALLDDARRLGDGLDGAHLVVGVHDAHQHRLGRHRLGQGVQVHEALAVHGQVGGAEALLLQLLDGVEDGVVLDGGGDDVVAAAAAGIGGAAHRQGVALAAAAGEDDLLRLAAQELGHRTAGGVQALAGLSRLGVEARGVAPVLAQVRQHGFQHARVQGGGGGVVEVDALAHTATDLPSDGAAPSSRGGSSLQGRRAIST